MLPGITAWSEREFLTRFRVHCTTEANDVELTRKLLYTEASTSGGSAIFSSATGSFSSSSNLTKTYQEYSVRRIESTGTNIPEGPGSPPAQEFR